MVRQQEAGDGSVNLGGENSGTIQIGLSFEDHQKALKEREAQIRADLERAHEGEKAVLQAELSAIGGKLENVEADYQQTLGELAEIKKQLARHDNQIDAVERQAAFDALDRGDRSIADALFAALEKKAQDRADDALEEAAEMAYQQGLIAEQDIRWQEAHDHFARAARLMPSFERLSKVRELLYRLGQYTKAAEMGEEIFAACRTEFSEDSPEFAKALDWHATVLQSRGQHNEAEPLFRRSMELIAEHSGEVTVDYASSLNNLALLLKTIGRFEEAEPLYREAVEIDKATIGEGHPDYAKRLNNLAALLLKLGKLGDAEPLFREAIEIGKATVGKSHPEYATHLSNHATMLRELGRLEDAEPLYRQAIEIDKATIGEEHPEYAIHLNNLANLLRDMGRYEEARPLYSQMNKIDLATLGKGHPEARKGAGSYARLLRAHFRDDPVLAELEATFGADIGGE